VREGVDAEQVSEPVSALIAACRALGITRLAMLSPYVADVSARLHTSSVVNAASALAAQGGVDGVFLSCTNLRSFDAIDPLEASTGLPVLCRPRAGRKLGQHRVEQQRERP